MMNGDYVHLCLGNNFINYPVIACENFPYKWILSFWYYFSGSRLFF